jgi:hypothetical protein
MTVATFSPFPLPQPGLAARPDSSAMRNMEPLPNPGFIPPSGSFPTSWPQPMAALPVAGPENAGSYAPSRAFGAPMPLFHAPPTLDPAPQSVPAPSAKNRESEPDFTDDDLREAFGPIVEQAVRSAVYAKENGIDTYLEPMLRATIRRALAEYAPAARPFQQPGVMDRFFWHVRALFTSRTYEDVFFEQTRRFQVEEVFLLDSSTLALVSFASCDPARHASVRRVTSTAQRLAMQVRDPSGQFHPAFEISTNHRAIARRGRHVILIAIVRGRPGEIVLADLEFALRRIEDHFRDQFAQEGSALLHELQPFLEDCLLIQAPASAAL